MTLLAKVRAWFKGYREPEPCRYLGCEKPSQHMCWDHGKQFFCLPNDPDILDLKLQYKAIKARYEAALVEQLAGLKSDGEQ